MKKKNKVKILNKDIEILGRVNLTQKALLAKHLAVMLHSGLPLAEALEIAEESAHGKLKRILSGLLRSVRSGHPLSSAMKEYPKVFNGFFINATFAGESSGTLSENLENISEQMNKERELVSKIKAAMTYPIIVLVATFALGMALSFIVFPKITPLFEGLNVELPITTRALLSFSHFVQSNTVLLFWGVLLGVTALMWIARQKFSHPVTHRLLLGTPLIGNVTKNSNLARMTSTLAMLLKSGVSIDEALDITEKTANNFYYKRALRRVSNEVSKGLKLSDSLEEHKYLFPTLTTRMIKVGEESGKYEETLFYLADFYQSEVDTSTKALSNAIEPLLLLIIGLVVGGLALSIITPIYEITGNIRR